jgi:hypothetical protein
MCLPISLILAWRLLEWQDNIQLKITDKGFAVNKAVAKFEKNDIKGMSRKYADSGEFVSHQGRDFR